MKSDETTPTAPDAAAHDEIDFTLAKQQENHRDAIALIREAHAIQVASLEEEIAKLKGELTALRSCTVGPLASPASTETLPNADDGWCAGCGNPDEDCLCDNPKDGE